jgi:hypothetical protein
MADMAYVHINGVRYLLADSQLERGVDQIRETIQGMVTGPRTEAVVLEVVVDEVRGRTAPLFIAPDRVATVMLEQVEAQDSSGGYI